MDFDFIFSSQDFNAPRPRYGNMHQGFRLGLGLDLDLASLDPVTTTFRSITNFPGAGAQAFNDSLPRSAFDILAGAITNAIGG